MANLKLSKKNAPPVVFCSHKRFFSFGCSFQTTSTCFPQQYKHLGCRLATSPTSMYSLQVTHTNIGYHFGSLNFNSWQCDVHTVAYSLEVQHQTKNGLQDDPYKKHSLLPRDKVCSLDFLGTTFYEPKRSKTHLGVATSCNLLTLQQCRKWLCHQCTNLKNWWGRSM